MPAVRKRAVSSFLDPFVFVRHHLVHGRDERHRHVTNGFRVGSQDTILPHGVKGEGQQSAAVRLHTAPQCPCHDRLHPECVHPWKYSLGGRACLHNTLCLAMWRRSPAGKGGADALPGACCCCGHILIEIEKLKWEGQSNNKSKIVLDTERIRSVLTCTPWPPGKRPSCAYPTRRVEARPRPGFALYYVKY